jgi:hypothetical protein
MQIQRCIPVLLIAAAVAIGGCGDGFAGPEPLPEADHPLYAHTGNHVGYHYQLKENQKAVQTSGGEFYDFRIAVTLFADGLAAGTATLSDPEVSSRRFQYNFRTGRTACEDGTPAAYFQGEGVDPAGRDQAWSWAVHILPYMDQGPLFRGEETWIEWTWEKTDPASRAGDSFVAPVSLYASPDICGSR